jgi:hypothetical protein
VASLAQDGRTDEKQEAIMDLEEFNIVQLELKGPRRLPGNHKRDGIPGPRVVIISGEGGNA